jgi:FlaA1/EpsC-like NDP-sugar epimerase
MKNVILKQPRSIKKLIQIIFDGLILYFAFMFSYVHNDGNLALAAQQFNSVVPFLAIPMCLGIFYLFGLYDSLIRYILVEMFVKTIFLYFIASIIFFSVSLAISEDFEWTHFVTFSLVSSICGFAGRFYVRSLLLSNKLINSSNVIIYGPNGSKNELLAAIKQSKNFIPVAFIDDNPELIGVLIGGVRVHHPKDLQKIVTEKEVTIILVAMSKVSHLSLKSISNLLKSNNLQIKEIPVIGDIISGRANITQLKTVKIEDLLGRKPVPPISKLMSLNTSNKSIMVTGAGGSIGSEICRQILESKPSKLVIVDHNEYGLYLIEREILQRIEELGIDIKLITIIENICNEKDIKKVLLDYSVDTVFHAAAYKHVPLLERNVYSALKNNILGTKALISASIASGVSSFTMISTDKAVRPTNVMGASKRFAELICQCYSMNQNNTNISIVRFGNVLGSSGSVIPLFNKQISNGGPLTVTHPNMTRYFMTVSEAAQLVIQASSMAAGGEVFLLDMGPSIKILDLAKSMIRLSGYEPYLIQENTDNEGPRSDQIEISFSNLRPGEKLYEELLITDSALPTSHPRISKAIEHSIGLEELNIFLDKMNMSIKVGNLQKTLNLLESLPLNYKSK